MSVNQKSKIPGYNKSVWFIRRDITNIKGLEKLTEKYIAIYDRNDQMFTVHREVTDLPNMEFLIHDSGPHNYEPKKKDLLFLNTVSRNKEVFSNKKIKSAIKARELQHTLVFPTIKELE